MSGSSRYLGFDVSSYPGDATMAWMWGHGFRVTGFYLNHARGGEDPSWVSRRAVLAHAGWGLAPLYLGWQMVDNHGHRLSAPTDPQSTAVTDAAEAIALMGKAGFEPGSTLYFDIEDGTPPSGTYEQYLLAWVDALSGAGFVPAVYCSHLCNAWAESQDLPHWCFHLVSTLPGPYDPGSLPQPAIDPGSMGVQFLQEVHLAGLPAQVDLNWFAVRDPSSAYATSQLTS